MKKIITLIFILALATSCSFLQNAQRDYPAESALITEAGNLLVERKLEKGLNIELDFDSSFAVTAQRSNEALKKALGRKTAANLFTKKGEVLAETERIYFRVWWQPFGTDSTEIKANYLRK